MVGISTMDTMDSIPDFAAQMEAFKRSDEAREQLLADVIQRYAQLTEEHTNLKSDYASEQHMRRSYQNEVQRMHLQLGNLENNSFVLALIDGDGVIFQDSLLSAAAHGGSEAASRLQHAIQDHIASIYGNSNHWPIMTHIYLSLDKLAMKLAHVGLLKNPQDLRAFAQSFNINQPLFSIIDVGQGKERADFKIKEMLRSFSDNPTCRHIIFGGCHDAGYLLNLDQYKHIPNKAARITLLESTVPYWGFGELPNFKRARFDAVFKPEALPDYVQPAYTQPPAQPPISAPLRTLTNRTTSPVASPPAPTNIVNAATVTASPSTTISSLAPTDSSSDPSWATVGKTGANDNGTISIAPKTAPKKKYVYYNKDGQRLDEPLPPRDKNAVEGIEKRMDKAGRNLCNHWHLNKGKCTNGNFCKFQHEPKLTAAETIALRYKTRSLACKRRDCENFDCYLGHQCSFERDQGYCPYPDSCNLRTSHGMDKTKHEAWDEEGNQFFSSK